MKATKKIFVEKWARDEIHIEDQIHLYDFKRIYPLATNFSDNQVAKITMKFCHDSEGRCMVVGQVVTTIIVECSRCLVDVEEALDFTFTVYPVSYKNLKTLPNSCEPVIVDEDGYLDVIDLVEDEIILALPDRALHEDIQICEANLNVKLNNQGTIYGCTEV